MFTKSNPGSQRRGWSAAAIAAFCIVATGCAAKAPHLSTLVEESAPTSADLAAQYDPAGTAFAPAGASTALVSCTVYSSTNRSGDMVISTSRHGLEYMAEALCPSVVNALYASVPYSWTPEQEVFATPQVAKCAARTGAREHVVGALAGGACAMQMGSVKPYGGYGFFGIVSKPNPGNNVVTKLLPPYGEPLVRAVQASRTEMRHLAHEMGREMVFIVSILVDPLKGDAWDIRRVEVAGYKAQERPRITASFGSGLGWASADAALRWQGRYRFWPGRDGVPGIEKLAESLAVAIRGHVQPTTAAGSEP